MSSPDRLLVIAPTGRDAQVIMAQLATAGMTAVVATAAEIVDAARVGELAAAIITDEAMATFDLTALAEALVAQPVWSDSPFLVLTRREFGGWTRARLADLLGNVTILERPVHPDVLISAVRSALRARARQRRAEAYLLARETAEAQVRDLAATLETRVDERTHALSRALAERAHTQRRLHDSEELYRYTVELTAQTPWTADADGKLLAIGPGWANHSGSAISDWSALVHVEDLEGMLATWWQATATATFFTCDFRVRGAGGLLRWCRSRAAPRLSPNGSVVRWYGTLEDIDDRQVAASSLRQMQAELIHVSRLSAMGAMASTLAHELNQPLTAVTNYVRGGRRLLADLPDAAPIQDALDHADRNAVRAGDIIRRVRELVTKKGDIQRRPESLEALVREACSLAMIDAHSTGIDFRLELGTTPITVVVDRIQIQQVILNLLRNAVEAVAGSLVRHVVLSTVAKAGSVCEVVVRDSGPGVPSECAGRLFEPFNTSKADGTGIGLSISRTIIEAHGGVIWHRPARGGGAAFGFSLVTLADAASPG